MIALSIGWLVLIAMFGWVPILMMRKKQTLNGWDYTCPFLGVILWFPLSAVGSTVSLSNFVVELFWITVASIAMLYLRWLLTLAKGKTPKTLSIVLTATPILTAIVIRLLMPTLAE